MNLIGDTCPVLVDDRCADMGGGFYYTPLRPYSPAPLKWCMEQLQRYEKATLIDVGAHVGCYTLLAKHHLGLTVHAFEPVPNTVLVLRENVLLNELNDRVTINQKGVSSYNGTGNLYAIKSPQGSGISMVDGVPAHHKDVDKQLVKVVTIDSYVEAHKLEPTFIKIDTEGGEKMVLMGAKRTIAKYHPFIITEYSSENTGQYGYAPHDIVKLLEELGYAWTNPEGTDIWAVHLKWNEIGKQSIEGED